MCKRAQNIPFSEKTQNITYCLTDRYKIRLSGLLIECTISSRKVHRINMMRLCVYKCLTNHLKRVNCMHACAIFDLLPARCSRCTNDSVSSILCHSFTNCRHKHHFTDCHTRGIMLLFIAKRTRHAATTTWDDVYACLRYHTK